MMNNNFKTNATLSENNCQAFGDSVDSKVTGYPKQSFNENGFKLNNKQSCFSSLWSIVILFFIAGLTSFQALADDGQFYLLGKYAHIGSTSSAGQNQYGVYLRWDLIDGDLPADIARIELHRDDLSEPLLRFTPSQLPTANTIASEIYAGIAQQQRLFKSITSLKEMALGEGESFNSQQFSNEILNRLQTARDANAENFNQQKVWAFFAARADFNIARAANRAYLDSSAVGNHTYELRAYNSPDENATMRLLGKISINASLDQIGKTQVLAARNFTQVLEISCNSIDRFSDHMTVSLNWQPGGSNVTERLANDLSLAGYDLYRTSSNINVATEQQLNLDISNLARTVNHNARGELNLPGLEKINQSLITNKGSSQSIEGDRQWQEGRDEIKAAGLKPGDKRIYYLVTKDYAGHYGPTVSALIEIPNRQKPKMPWGLNSVIDAENDGAILFWDAVNVENYIAYYASNNETDDRQICNINTAVADGFIEYVKIDESCATDTLRQEILNVNQYRLYRFDSFNEAKDFKDYDGDGIDDALEVGSAACTFTPDAGSGNNRLIASGAQLAPLQYLDQNIATSQHYWYRLSSVTAGAIASELTPPHQVTMIDRTPPDAPEIEITRACNTKKGHTQAQCDAAVEDGDLGYGFSAKLTVGPGECAELYVRIDGDLARVASSCGTDDPQNLSYGFGSGEFCGVGVAIDVDGNVSAGTRLPCSVVVDDIPVPMPQFRRFNLDETAADFEWRLPLLPISAINMEISHNGTVEQLQTIAVAGQAPTSTQQYQQTFSALEGAGDEWCVRLQSIGLVVDGILPNTSDWTAKRCQIRRISSLHNPDNLPWPAAQNLGFNRTDLLAHSGGEYVAEGRGLLERYFLFVDLQTLNANQSDCQYIDLPDPEAPNVIPLFARVNCDNKLQLENIVMDQFPMIVYRQSTTPDGAKGPWVQVSPLLDKLHWRLKPVHNLVDPYFGVYRVELLGSERRFVYIDRYPHLQGYQYQYQFVSLDERGGIREVNRSTVVSTQGEQ